MTIIQPDRQVIIVDDRHNGPPTIFWVDPISPADKINHLHVRIVTTPFRISARKDIGKCIRQPG